jgi:hydroxylamine reductase (hybrid-cluster protein)
VKELADKNKTETTPHTHKKAAELGNFVRNIADGTTAHSEQAQMVARQFLAAAKGEKPGATINDEAKLKRIAAELGIKTEGRPVNKIGIELGELILNEFNKQAGELLFLKRAPPKRQEIWRKNGIAPSGINNEVAATVKLANNGADNDKSLLKQGERCALTNGWGSNMIAAELEDIMFGTPAPKLGSIHYGAPADAGAKYELITGFSPEAIIYALGGSFRGSLTPLIENIVNGRIRGIAGIFDCNTTFVRHDDANVTVVKELIKNDILVLFTGSSAGSMAKAGLVLPEGQQYAGDGLRSVCEAVGLPPVLHMGTGVDSCRILIAAAAIVAEAKLGDISDLPACIASPEEMNDKSTAVGQCFVSSGFYTISSTAWGAESTAPVPHSLGAEMENKYGGMWDYEADPLKMAHKMIALIDKKRKALGIDKARERVLYDMAMRRELI